MNNPVASKEKLIQDAKEIVKEKGIAGISMRYLAKQSGISVGAVYNYFPNKEQLIHETVGSIWGEIFHESKDSFEVLSFLESVSRLFESVAAGKKRYPKFFTNQEVVVAFSSFKETSILKQYLSHIKESLVTALLADPKIRKDLFSPEFSPEKYVAYIFQLFLYELAEEKSGESLLIFIETFLYDTKEEN